jgi:hypothetical protein
LIAVYRALGRDEAAWSVEKGRIAAERRGLSFDGPLYPIVDDVALLPSPCSDGVQASTREAALLGGSPPSTEMLRARAFPLVNSGKVVAITARGNRTRVLDAPVCVPGACGSLQAGFALDDAGGAGVLVPSWLVAGFRVEGYRPIEPPSERAHEGEGARAVRFVDEAGRTRVDVEGASYTLHLRTFDGWRAVGTWPLARTGARPIAQASEHEREVLLFFSGTSSRGCCPQEVEAWVERVGGLDEDVTHARGRVFSSGYAPACPQERFGGLPGEPRCARLPEGCKLGAP